MAYDLWATGIILMIVAWDYYLNKNDTPALEQLLLHIIQPVLRTRRSRVLTLEEKGMVDGIFANLFPRYEMNLLDTNPLNRFICLRPTRQQQSVP